MTEVNHTPTPLYAECMGCGRQVKFFMPGEYVERSAYEGLVSENAELKAENERLKSRGIEDMQHEIAELRRLLANPCRFPTMEGPCGECESCVNIARKLNG